MAGDARSLVRFTPTPIPGAVLIDIEPRTDERGYFARAWDNDEFAAHGIDPTIAQMNTSHTLTAGTFRGFHWNPAPLGEAKTVRCTSGSVFDVIVDMRTDSPTHRQWYGVELSAVNQRMLHIPAEVANGFLITSDHMTLLYTTTRTHLPGIEQGCRYDDPSLAIDWPRSVEIVSDKDRSWPDLPVA